MAARLEPDAIEFLKRGLDRRKTVMPAHSLLQPGTIARPGSSI